MRDKTLLRQLQALPLDAKVLMSQQRIREWYNYFNGNVCISFSGGKDSTVLVHLVHDMYPNVPLVFANTGLEYPEIQAFARDMGAEFVRPKMNFIEVVTRYGYPIISKEVAEAISFARRIVPIGGGYNTESRETSNESNFKDYGYHAKDGIGRSTRERAYPEIKGRTGWRRVNLTGNTPPQGFRENSEWNSTEQDHLGNSKKQKRSQKNRTLQKTTLGEVTEPG